MADNLPPSSADVTESESLNLPETSGPYRPVMGLLYLYLYTLRYTTDSPALKFTVLRLTSACIQTGT
jgi:hypothetical protein